MGKTLRRDTLRRKLTNQKCVDSIIQVSQSKLQSYVGIATSMATVATFLAGITVSAVYLIPASGTTQCTYNCKLVSTSLSIAFFFFVVGLLCTFLIQMALRPIVAGEVDHVDSVQRWNKIAHNVISIHTFSLSIGVLFLGLGLIGFGQAIVGGLVIVTGVTVFLCYVGLITLL